MSIALELETLALSGFDSASVGIESGNHGFYVQASKGGIYAQIAVEEPCPNDCQSNHFIISPGANKAATDEHGNIEPFDAEYRLPTMPELTESKKEDELLVNRRGAMFSLLAKKLSLSGINGSDIDHVDILQNHATVLLKNGTALMVFDIPFDFYLTIPGDVVRFFFQSSLASSDHVFLGLSSTQAFINDHSSEIIFPRVIDCAAGSLKGDMDHCNIVSGPISQFAGHIERNEFAFAAFYGPLFSQRVYHCIAYGMLFILNDTKTACLVMKNEEEDYSNE